VPLFKRGWHRSCGNYLGRAKEHRIKNEAGLARLSLSTGTVQVVPLASLDSLVRVLYLCPGPGHCFSSGSDCDLRGPGYFLIFKDVRGYSWVAPGPDLPTLAAYRVYMLPKSRTGILRLSESLFKVPGGKRRFGRPPEGSRTFVE